MSKIKVTLVSGQNLMAARLATACDPFCILKLGSQKFISTTKRGINPVWNEGFIFNYTPAATTLEIDVQDKDKIKVTYSENIGKCTLDLAPLISKLPVATDVRTKYGSLQLRIEDPNNAAKLGNTLGATTTAKPAAKPTSTTSTATAKPAATTAAKPTTTTATKPTTTTATKPTTTTATKPTAAKPATTTAAKPTTTTSSSSKPTGKPKKQSKYGDQKNPHKIAASYAKHDPSFKPLDEEDAWVPPTNLPDKFEPTDIEIAEKKKRWARFATFLAKPFEYDSKYKKYLQQLDAMGCINLERVTREQIPAVEINYCVALFFNPYEDLPHTLDMGPVNDALNLAKLFVDRGYRVTYLCDATPREYYRWVDWLLSTVEKEIVIYFSGHGTQIPDTTGKEKDGMSEVLVFYDETRKKNAKGGTVPKLTPVAGITNETVDDSCMHKLIMSKEYPETRIVLLTDCCHSGTMFNFDQKTKGNKRTTPPPNVICVGSAQDSQTAKQTVLGGVESGVFTYNFSTLVRSNPHASFLELQQFMAKQIAKYQTIQLTGSEDELFSEPMVIDVPPEEVEMQLADITEDVLGAPPASITSIPEVDVPSEIEQEIARHNWDAFCDELAKPAPYDSKYRTSLQKLDAMGCINLERITREQIPPNIYISKCLAMFFNPYEGLAHTLDMGPVNDALLLGELFLSRGYHVVYICDATPHEYYRWMDWLLDNVEDEIVSFFSGHGTQIKDTTGKEKDGLSEVLVFFDSSRKSGAATATKKVTPVKGITNETVDDTCMFDLITSKEYPQTRVVLLTDCCHSGTMFNFDQSVGGSGKGITPPLNVVCVGSAQDSQTAKQTVLGGAETGVFTYNFTQLLKSKPATTFLDLQQYMAKQIAKYQTIQLTGSSSSLFSHPIIV